MGISSYGVKLQKLRSASPGELASRLRYRAYLAYERRRWQAGAFARPSRLQEALRADLRQEDWRKRLLEARRSSSPRWFPSIDRQEQMRSVLEVARSAGMRAHLDGARLMNAVVASGVPAHEWAAPFSPAHAS